MTAVSVPDKLLAEIRSGQRFLLSSHANPDGDAVGSEIALARILRKLGKSVLIWNRDVTPNVYLALPGADKIHVGEEPPADFPEAFDRFLLLECPSVDRTGLERWLEELPLLNVDHHLGNQLYGKVNWVDSGAPSVGELVLRLSRELKVELDPDTATALYLTLVTDTGNFRFSNATPRAFNAAAALVEEGASPETVSGWLFESQPEGMVRLLGEMLQTLERHGDGSVATVVLTPEMFQRSGATRADSEGLIDYPRAIEGVGLVALLRQLDDGQIKVSLRSRGTTDVESVARRHGGGGHRNAAGCTVDGPVEAVRRTMVDELNELSAQTPAAAPSAEETTR